MVCEQGYPASARIAVVDTNSSSSPVPQFTAVPDAALIPAQRRRRRCADMVL
ncbi:hypothetical protein GIY30_13445 [Gordonia sp. HNM0687]|uniref:Uncharacterized protein n=1 Tax=Gordonia mangrovi TaxID=2665643 RepID=A0A6L7GRZ2_9ACTN|nr:hypothetical protein [Gordonia mangrovi]MXP22343.1 hypothetical protein [Gordonia mangrovi]UVF77765.1 hypothetical protein NWF22_21295 [Gordonia mangrovi]